MGTSLPFRVLDEEVEMDQKNRVAALRIFEAAPSIRYPPVKRTARENDPVDREVERRLGHTPARKQIKNLKIMMDAADGDPAKAKALLRVHARAIDLLATSLLKTP